MAQKDRIVLNGNPVSEGVAVARAYVYEPLEPDVHPNCFAPGKEREKLDAFHRAVEQAKEELAALGEELGPDCAEQAKIFLAHREFLEDEELLSETETAITEELLEPDAAVEKVFSEFAGLLGGVKDPLIAARAADLQDVKRRLKCVCQGRKTQKLFGFEEDVIIVARDLLPSDTASLDRTHVKGIVTQIGGANSHSAILARSFRIPAVSGVADALRKIPQKTLLALDALKGEVILQPSEEETALYNGLREDIRRRQKEEEKYLSRPGAMRDGEVVEMGINIGSCEFDVPKQHYDFVGLFRTEFLYMENSALPTEEEQFTAYKKALQRAGGKTVTLRTLDIGGDKTLPYMPLPAEGNPFLGNRALRLCFSRPDLFRTQLRAALRASVYGDLQLMFPMVGGIEDILQAKEYVREVMAQLDDEGSSYDPDIRTGIMIEIPSVALVADLAAAEVDFASVGSNDLTQYVCAADRMNPAVSAYYQNCSPAVLRLLEMVFTAFALQNKPVSVCGEMAGDPRFAVLLAGLGARKLSMNPVSLAGVKAVLARFSLAEARQLALQCLQFRTQEEILRYLREKIK